MSPWAMTLPMDFESQFFFWIAISRNAMANWHEMKEIWVDKLFDPRCDLEIWPLPWTWTWIFVSAPLNVLFAMHKPSGRNSSWKTPSYECVGSSCLHRCPHPLLGWFDFTPCDVKYWVFTLQPLRGYCRRPSGRQGRQAPLTLSRP